jgi:hypothetical protein
MELTHRFVHHKLTISVDFTFQSSTFKLLFIITLLLFSLKSSNVQVPHVWRYICKSCTYAGPTCSMPSCPIDTKNIYLPFISINILQMILV